MHLTPGTVYNIRLGSSEYPVDTHGKYIGPGDIVRFHKFRGLSGSILTVHESNIEFAAQEAARAQANETTGS
jgi:hypothetical protein